MQLIVDKWRTLATSLVVGALAVCMCAAIADNIVWGNVRVACASDENIVWGNNADNIVWGNAVPTVGRG